MPVSQEDGWSPETYARNASFVYSSASTGPVLALLNAQPGERIIDFGCGSGEVTLEIRRIVDGGEEGAEGGVVVGVDASANMIEKARSNGLHHAFVSDIQDLQFPPAWPPPLKTSFDAVFSNAALHWCKRDPRGVLRNVKKVLKPGGRFVAELGGWMNCVGVRAGLYEVLRRRGYDPEAMDPWHFPTVGAYKALLEEAGFEVPEIVLHPRLTPLPGSLYDWLATFCRHSWLRDVPEGEAEQIMREVEDVCKADCRDEQGRWAIMYVRLRFLAILRYTNNNRML